MIYMIALLLLTVAGIACLVLVAIFAIECIAGVWPSGRRPERALSIRPAIAVLIPAHNEALGIAATLRSIGEQIRGGDRIVVVADNCDDETATIARSFGAEVIERRDSVNRGKGHALAAGVAHLRQAPPAIVVFIDADCQIANGTLDALAADVMAFERPVQARNLQVAQPGASIGLAIGEFAFRIKNHVRPLGMSRLGLPCLMTGTGMALPWNLVEQANLATGHLVEDMKFALELAQKGAPPRFCERALVTSLFPTSTEAVETQRRRWEGGHLAMMRFAVGALSRPSAWRSAAYCALLLDVLVPPLTLLAGAVAFMTLVAACAAILSVGLLPLTIAVAAALLFLLAIGLSWAAFATELLPPRQLVRLPAYAIAKLYKYPRMLFSSGRHEWVRTDRTRPQ